MNPIKKAISNMEIADSFKKTYIESFIQEYVKEHPEILPKIVTGVIDKNKTDIEKLKEQRFNLSLNFISVLELIQFGKVKSSFMQSFTGLIGNKKMEDKLNEGLLKKIESVQLEK